MSSFAKICNFLTKNTCQTKKIMLKYTKQRLQFVTKKIRKERNNMEIKKDMTIGELLEKAPEKADILLEAGMHCLGCPASQAETIEEACEVHGIDVEEIIEKLNK